MTLDNYPLQTALKLNLTTFFLIFMSYGLGISQGALYTDATFIKTTNTNLPVGTLDGAGGVDLSGSATYSIPIKLLPGT
nr:hypothetical protein [Saprospiraceae bacterium]